LTKSGKALLKQCPLLKGRMPILELMPLGRWTKNTQQLMYFYRGADKINVGSAFLGGYYRAIAQGLSHNAALLAGNNVAKITQFSYRSIDLPIFMSSGGIVGKYLGQFKTWPINYAELLLGWSHQGKVGAWKITRYLLANAGFVYAMKEKFGIDYSRILPTKICRLWGFRQTISPGSPFFSMYDDWGKFMYGITTGNKQTTSRAINSILHFDLPSIIPAGVMLHKGIKAATGEAELKSLFFPVEYKTPEEVKRGEAKKKRETVILP